VILPARILRLSAICLVLLAVFPARGDALDEMVRAQMRWQRIPGLSLAVMKDGKVVASRAYGFANLETGTAARPDSVYRIASLSKQFLAAGILVLVQDGKLRLDDPVRDHLPGTPEAWKGITIRMLLNHTSGLVRELPAFDPMKVQPDAEVLASTYALPLQFEPGTGWDYSNTNYYALAEVIRSVSDEEWGTFIGKRVLAPAGMTSTRPLTPEIVPGRARGYDVRGGRVLNAAEWLAVRPSGGFLSTVTDFEKWDAALYKDVPLSASTRAAMWTPAVVGNETRPYGFGWFVDTLRGHRHVHHDGGVPGFVAQFHRFPDDGVSVVLMANVGNRDITDLALQVASRWIPGLLPPPEPAIADPIPAVTGRLRSFLTALQTGTFDATLFTEQAAGFVREDLSRGFAETLREQGRLVRMELLEQKTESDLRVYRYRVTYPHLTLFATFKLDAENRVAAWSLTD
jgi:D-alanyl-D-alanine carboxypeptidase